MLLQMSLAEYKKRKQKLKPKISQHQRRFVSSAVLAKTHLPVTVKNPVNSPPPTSIKQSTKSGFLDFFAISGDLSVVHLYV